ncbi:TetR/AcrR family transcriptional regulator [Cellulomonas denverensis]|uniref:TetR/AcrR family transcriptional regulator n=1 Tax=Cellulomonas denverensis TaxID=264297 RepID=UPI0035E5B29C
MPTRRGRPRASSRAMLEEAAGELFLERGYDATSVADITQRAGVSRSSFFNYFDQKSDLLWAGFDDLVTRLRADLAAPTACAGSSAARTALLRLAGDLPADHVALAFTQSDAMGLGEDLHLAAARRTLAVADALLPAAAGLDPLHARVAATAWSGALIAAVQEWSRAGADRTSLPNLLTRALAPVAGAFD